MTDFRKAIGSNVGGVDENYLEQEAEDAAEREKLRLVKLKIRLEADRHKGRKTDQRVQPQSVARDPGF